MIESTIQESNALYTHGTLLRKQSLLLDTSALRRYGEQVQGTLDFWTYVYQHPQIYDLYISEETERELNVQFRSGRIPQKQVDMISNQILSQ
jgi:hypothetical protein